MGWSTSSDPVPDFGLHNLIQCTFSNDFRASVSRYGYEIGREPDMFIWTPKHGSSSCNLWAQQTAEDSGATFLLLKMSILMILLVMFGVLHPGYLLLKMRWNSIVDP